MGSRWRLFVLELSRLGRGRTVVLGLVGLLSAGIAAVESGRTIIERQRAVLTDRATVQHAQHRAVLDPQPATADGGDQLYYLSFHTAHVPDRWAAVSLGTRETHAYNLKIRLLALEGQLYDGELANASLLAFGALDLALVFVFLSPLLTIALTFNVLSEEVEGGTWPLVCAQPVRPWMVLTMKLSARAVLAVAPIILLWAIAGLRLGLAWDGRAVAFGAIAVAHVLVWCAVAAMVAAAGRTSEFNAVVLTALWVVLAMLGPATLNVVAALRYPVPEALELTVRQRQGYHTAWDRPVAETMDAFYRRYPEWRGQSVPETAYSNAWYYAMQQRGDDHAAASARAYAETLQARLTFVRRGALLFPPALAQQAFDTLAATDLRSHLLYLASVRRYHEALKAHFFPSIFQKSTIVEVPWARAPVHEHVASARASDASVQLCTLGVQLVMGIGVACMALAHRQSAHWAHRR